MNNRLLKKKKNLVLPFFLKKPTYLVTFVNNLLLITRDLQRINNAMRVIKKFLRVRGLYLCQKKTKIIKMKIGSKFNFLGRTFYLKNRANRNFYISPSDQSTSFFMKTLKEITSKSSIVLTLKKEIRKVNKLIFSYNKYFTLDNNRMNLKKKLKNFIRKRLMK